MSSKLTATQNVIRNKFEKVHTNRLEHEQDVEQSFPSTQQQHEPVTTELTHNSINKQQCITESKIEYTPRTVQKSRSRDPNELCDRLRMKISSGDMKSINVIIGELRDLEIIV